MAVVFNIFFNIECSYSLAPGRHPVRSSVRFHQSSFYKYLENYKVFEVNSKILPQKIQCKMGSGTHARRTNHFRDINWFNLGFKLTMCFEFSKIH